MRAGAFFGLLRGFSPSAAEPGAARFDRQGALFKKALSPQRSSGVEPMPPESDAKSRSAGSVPSASRAGPRRSFFLQPRLFCGQGTAQLRPAGQNRALFPPVFPRPFPFSCSPPLFFPMQKTSPAGLFRPAGLVFCSFSSFARPVLRGRRLDQCCCR